MLLGDARRGKLPENIVGFGRALRRAGVRLDSARIALACEAARWVDVAHKADLGAALETVLVSREQDRAVFRELFDAYFRDPEVAHKLLAQMLPSAEGRAEPTKRRPRVREALTPQRVFGSQAPRPAEDTVEFDAAMTASDLQRLRQADFNALSASEYRLVERLARDIPLPLPQVSARRLRPDDRGTRLNWRGALHEATRTGGELMQLPRLSRRAEPLPLLILVDVSGSMERYARLLLAFLHAATRQVGGRRVRRDLFAFGTHLTDLTPALRLADTDEMLGAANTLIDDYGGGTRLGASLTTLRTQYARRLVGRRTLVLLVSDGLDTGEPEHLNAELAWLRRHCRRLLWLNPLLRYEGYAPLARGAAALHRHADGMLAIHNLSRLEDLAGSLATLMTSR
ncbi:vWA domain-containing protein [Hylemonella sp. W303a]|uniref:vWA domain-containing protein n=1 Tax=Hylemonella sp. W303a TaxID=3389873 RepID=UPI00396B2E63